LSISPWSQSTLAGIAELAPAGMTNNGRRPFTLVMAVLYASRMVGEASLA